MPLRKRVNRHHLASWQPVNREHALLRFESVFQPESIKSFGRGRVFVYALSLAQTICLDLGSEAMRGLGTRTPEPKARRTRHARTKTERCTRSKANWIERTLAGGKTPPSLERRSSRACFAYQEIAACVQGRRRGRVRTPEHAQTIRESSPPAAPLLRVAPWDAPLSSRLVRFRSRPRGVEPSPPIERTANSF